MGSAREHGMDRRGRWTAAILAAVLVALLAGCSAAPTPWVKPYEREHFADPIMAANRDPVSSIYFEHVWESREGSRGATGAVGGGCGCN